MERGYGYKAPTHVGGATPISNTTTNVPSATSAAVRLKTMDRALRAEIMGNAQRRYQSAARELWIRTQAEVQAQVKAAAHQQPRLRNEGQVYAHADQGAHARQWPPPPIQLPVPFPVRPVQSQPTVRTHPPVQVLPSRPEHYPTQSPLPRPVSHVPTSSPNTSNPIFYRFRQVPKYSSTSNNNTEQPNAPKAYKEEDLKVDELKRRYFAQLFNPPNRRYTLTGYYGHPIHPIGGYAPYPRGTSGTPARTLADEYLDFYMPPRRGPQSGSNYRPRERRPSEDTQYHQDEDASQRPRNSVTEISQRNETPEVRHQQRENEYAQPLRSPAPMDRENIGQSQSTKSKLTFLLNPTESRDRLRDTERDPQTVERESAQCDCQKQNKPSSSNSNQPTRHERQIGNPNRYREHVLSSSSPSSSKRKLDDEDSPMHTHTHSSNERSPCLNCSGTGTSGIGTSNRVNAKRKWSRPPSPPIPRRGEGNYEEREGGRDEEEPRRAKRRALRRLIMEPYSSSDNQSEYGPEEEERDDTYISQTKTQTQINDSDQTYSRSRSCSRHTNHHNNNHKHFAHSATCDQVSVGDRVRSGRESEVDPTGSANIAPNEDGGEDDSGSHGRRGRHDRHDGRASGSIVRDDNPQAQADEVTRKYDFRPRMKANTR